MSRLPPLASVLLVAVAARGQAPAPPVPDWSQPGSATHQQIGPPAEFHRASRIYRTPIGIFEGQADVGAALAPASARFDAAAGRYAITSAGYNVWYTRDEFRFLWRRLSGDVSLAADVAFPDPKGFFDRKALLVIRQDLDDGAKEALVAVHGDGMLHLAQRPAKNVRINDLEFRVGGRGSRPGGKGPDDLVTVVPRRIGIEKHGDTVQLFASLEGEPMHAWGPPIRIHLDGPFFVGIGFCSHLPTTSDTAVLSRVVLANAAGRVR